MSGDFISEVRKIAHNDKRYEQEAYTFIMESLHDYTLKHDVKPGVHITARQFMDGVIDYARKSFGPMAKFTLDSWGIRSTADVGHIVFNMIAVGLMGKTEDDCLEDFFEVFDFNDVFQEDLPHG